MATATRKKKNYLDMTVDELVAETSQFDEEMVIDDSEEMTPAQKAQWNRVKRKRGRPRVGAGAESICLSIERTILRQADKLASALGMSRAQLFMAALVALITEEVIRRRK